MDREEILKKPSPPTLAARMKWNCRSSKTGSRFGMGIGMLVCVVLINVNPVACIFAFKIYDVSIPNGNFTERQAANASRQHQKIQKCQKHEPEELAVHLHVVRQTISKWEKGLSVPDAEVLIHMAQVLEVPVSALAVEIPNTETADLQKNWNGSTRSFPRPISAPRSFIGQMENGT